MNPNRFFVTYVSGLLGVDGTRLADAYRLAARHYQIDNISIPSGVGAAVGEEGEERLLLRKWIDEQRASDVKSVSIAVQDDASDDPDDDWDDAGSEDLERHMLAGFAGGLPILMRVDTRSSRTIYVQGTVSGPRLLLTSSLFIELINAQSDPDFFWPDVLDEINQFHRCNGRDEIEGHSLQTHLLSLEGVHAWEFMGQQIFREVQVESYTYGKTFVIPSEFSNYVEEVKPVWAKLEPMVWLEIVDEDELSAAALLRLIKAQDLGDSIWKMAADRGQLTEKLDEYDELSDFPDIAAANWPSFLAGLADEDVSPIGQVLVELVRLECQSRGVQPRIPDDLANIFGPDEEERCRLHFRSRLQYDLGWMIRETDDPGMLFVLDRIDGHVALEAPLPRLQARQEFIEALTLARDFSQRVDSPFYPVLSAARHLASKAVGAGPLRITVLEELDPDLDLGVLPSVQRFIEAFEPFGWGADRLLGLAAISVADVFGGMGSWNDQAFEGADQAVFHEVSSTLFTAMNRYFEALVSVET